MLSHVPGIGFVNLTEPDIVRHELVQRIVGAYEGAEKRARIPLFRNRDQAPPRHHPNRFDGSEEGEGDGREAEGESATTSEASGATETPSDNEAQ